MNFKIVSIVLLLLVSWNRAQGATEPEPIPSVSGKALLCDRWHLSFETQTWTCLIQPRQVTLARGHSTDEVIKKLNDKIEALDKRLKELEK